MRASGTGVSQEEVVHVRRAGIEAQRRLRRLRASSPRGDEAGVEPEVRAEHERAVVIDVVAHVVVGGRRLRRRRLQRRMRVDDARRDVEAGLRDADHAGAAVVVRDVLQQPLDGVVGVGALVDVLRAPCPG